MADDGHLSRPVSRHMGRGDADRLSRALGAGTDVLMDTTAYDHDHARQLIAVQDRVGGFVVVSSASVYRDDAGRTLDEAMQNGFPELPNPIPESNSTVNPATLPHWPGSLPNVQDDES